MSAGMKLLGGRITRKWVLFIAISICGSFAFGAARTNQVADPAAVLFTRAIQYLATNDFAGAREQWAAVLSLTNVTPAHHSLAILEMARSHERQGNSAAARVEYGRLATVRSAPEHHRDEAARRIAQLGRGPDAPRVQPAERRMRVNPLPRPGVEFNVAPGGSDANPGTRDRPFASLERARNAVRALKTAGPFPAGGVAIVIDGGTYPVRQTFELTAADSGTPTAPIIYRAGGAVAPVFTGGTTLRGFQPVTNQAVLARLPSEARGKVAQLDLRAAGMTNLWPLQLGGFGSGRGFKTHPNIELFFNGQALPLARWPNDGFIKIANISTNDGHSIHGQAGSKAGVFTYEGDRPARWTEEKDVRLYGYWFWDWADSYEKVASIDTTNRVITLEPPFHNYGYRKGQSFYALNLLSEIDQPGEWYLDRGNGILYLWPPADPNASLVEMSAAPFTFVEVKGASNVQFRGITWDLGSADAISVTGGESCMFAGCTIRRFAGNGISINGGKRHGILSSDVFSLGRGGIRIAGGNRRNLERGDHFVENCHIYDLSRIDHTYTPAVQVSGVGHRVAHNLMHTIRSSAINVSGNDHLVELNEAGRVVQESDDQGAVDMWGNPTFLGNVYRWNYFHHIGPWKQARTQPALGQAGIRLDDAITGVLIYENIFRHAATGKHGFGGVQIHGGKDNIIDRNLFIDCAQAISFSPWAESRWLEHLRKFVPSKEVDLALYTNRYPEMARLEIGANVNQIWRNQFLNCGRVLRNDRGSRLIGNVEVPGPNALSSALVSYPVATNAAVMDIPLGEIGLYADQWRSELPVSVINALRRDE